MMKNGTIIDVAKKFALQTINGLNESVTAYHAVKYCRDRLLSNGFLELNEK
jgi:aspartyl aminopeptidase